MIRWRCATRSTCSASKTSCGPSTIPISRWHRQWPSWIRRPCQMKSGTSSITPMRSAFSTSRRSNVAEPPVPSSCLESGDPAAKRVEGHDDEDPDDIDARQAEAEAFRKEAIGRQELLSREALRDAERNREGMNEIEVRDVERQRRATERDEYVANRAAQAFGKRADDRGRAQRHQDVQKARRILRRRKEGPHRVPGLRIAVHVRGTHQHERNDQRYADTQYTRIPRLRGKLEKVGCVVVVVLL